MGTDEMHDSLPLHAITQVNRVWYLFHVDIDLICLRPCFDSDTCVVLLMQVLDVISSRDQAKDEDLVAFFFKRYSSLVTQAIEESGLNLHKGM